MLQGCSLTLPVVGRLQSTTETFAGKATGYLDGGGKLVITTSNGTQCKGVFVYTTGRKGEGTFECSDGRSGPFEFVSTGRRGTGTGTLGGQTFTFTFGKDAA